MIITRLLGGLGNQMFQYAAGLALAEQRRTVLKLDVDWFRDDPAYEAHNRYALSCFNVIEQFATQEEIDRAGGVQLTRTERWGVAAARALRFHRHARRFDGPAHTHDQADWRYYPGFLAQPDPTYLRGMWQSPRFFASCEDLLRLHFTFRYPAQPAVHEMARRIAGGPSAAVHFRRGDYVRNATFNQGIGVLGLDYYQRAVARLRERHPDVTLYIFSDDIDAIEREFRPAGPHVFVRATQPWHSYDKIRLMSGCQHAILSNSTFAWWAAWMNPAPGRTVIAPDPWLADPAKDSAEMILPGWTGMKLRA